MASEQEGRKRDERERRENKCEAARQSREITGDEVRSEGGTGVRNSDRV